jgi:GT2 family glycosyltransferase
VLELLERRTEARRARDWKTADALRDRIRALGWQPIDGAESSTAAPLLPSAPGDGVAYARSEDLESRLDEPAVVDLSLVVVVEDHPDDLERFGRGLATHPISVAHEIMVVENAPSADARLVLGTLEQAAGTSPVVLETSERLGWADAVNLGLRRSRGRIVTLIDTSVEPAGAWAERLLAAFDDETVGVAGPWGVTSPDGRQFEEAAPGEVDAVQAYCMAFRREALRAVGGFDHRFRWYRNADLDISFAIRAAGWRTVQTEPLPLIRHEHRGWTDLPDAERDRLSRRNFYRFLKHWGDRRDLLIGRAQGRPRRSSGRTRDR